MAEQIAGPTHGPLQDRQQCIQMGPLSATASVLCRFKATGITTSDKDRSDPEENSLLCDRPGIDTQESTDPGRKRWQVGSRTRNPEQHLVNLLRIQEGDGQED